MSLKHLIVYGIIYAICSFSEPFLEQYVSHSGASLKNRILLAFVGMAKFLILLAVLLNYTEPLAKDLKSNGLKVNSLSAFAVILWVQQILDCVSGIVSSQLKIGTYSS